MADYEDLIKRLRETSKDFSELDHVSVLLLEAADAVEELSDKVSRAVVFFDSKEIAEGARRFMECSMRLPCKSPDVYDPAWQKVHMDMGFYSPLGELYKAIGLYDEPPKEET